MEQLQRTRITSKFDLRISHPKACRATTMAIRSTPAELVSPRHQWYEERIWLSNNVGVWKRERLGEKAKDIEDQVKDLKSIKNSYQLHVNVLEIKEQQYKLLNTKEKVFEEREKQFLE